MLVILTDKQILNPKQVCQSCLLANEDGLPRWDRGKLSCGQQLHAIPERQPCLYQCQMGFKIASIDIA